MSDEKHYVIVKVDEDGNPLSWITPDHLEDISELMEDYGITRFMDSLPDERDRDPSYWHDGQALLLEVRVLRVRPKEVVQSWTIE